mmetsp:Transcript_34659/g.82813  ORF Transcript_34659/g.82813 Transcript_34659/m.82813 type:complete len:116 (-) Transcript_34659:442-789(-)
MGAIEPAIVPVIVKKDHIRPRIGVISGLPITALEKRAWRDGPIMGNPVKPMIVGTMNRHAGAPRIHQLSIKRPATNQQKKPDATIVVSDKYFTRIAAMTVIVILRMELNPNTAET